MFQFTRSLLKSWSKRARASRRNAPKRVRLGMEALEGRVVPVTWTVNLPDGLGACNPASVSLRQAVICANPANDVIELNLVGNYPLNFPGAPGDANPASGDIDIISKTNLLIQIAPGLVPCSVTIDGQWLDRIFDIDGNSSVTIRNINLVNGVAWDAGFGLTEEGGAIRSYGSLQYSDCTIQSNWADRGGAIASMAGSLIVNNAVIDSNYAITSGGGVYNQGSGAQFNFVTLMQNGADVGGGVHNTTTAVFFFSGFSANWATNLGGGLFNTGTATHMTTRYVSNWAQQDGGAIYTTGLNTSVSLLNRSDLLFNQANRGGGVFSRSMLMVTDSELDGNFASADGGAILASGDQLFIMERSTVSNNYARGIGGGIATSTVSSILNSTISGNHAGGVGGGVFYYTDPWATLLMQHVTVTENWAFAGGGIYTWNNGGTSLAVLHNSIVAMNYEWGGSFDDVNSNGLLLSASGFNNLLSQANGWGLLAANGNMFSTNPMLLPLANNGGPWGTRTHALTSASLAFNAASVSFMLPTDQRGNARPSFGSPDIGAFEF